MRKNIISVLAMLIIAVGSIVYIASVGLRVADPSSLKATINVPDTNGLLVGSRVLLRGIEIGHVASISPSSEGVDLTWRYKDEYRIPRNSTFRVDNLSALGEAYVSVLPQSSTGPYLTNGEHVDGSSVSVASTFKDLSEQLTKLLRQVDSAAVRRIFAELDSGLPEGTETVGSLNHAGRLLSAELTEQADSMVTLFSTLQPLLMRMSDVPGQLARTMPNLYRLFDNMTVFSNGASGIFLGSPIGKYDPPYGMYDSMEVGAVPLIAELQKFLDENASDLNKIGTNLLPVTRAGAASMRTVDVGRILDSFLDGTGGGKGPLEIHFRAPAG